MPHLASGALWIQKCTTIFLEYEPSPKMWIIGEGIGSLSQKNELDSPPHTYLNAPTQVSPLRHQSEVLTGALSQ